jgi:endo-1,4-beta-xylanase
MVALSHLAIALAAIAPALAAPIAEVPVQKRGPHNLVMGPDHPLMLARRNLTMSRRSTNYDQDYIGGTVDFAPASGEFYVAWDTTDDFVVGVNWNPGSTLYETNPPSLLLLFFPSP